MRLTSTQIVSFILFIFVLLCIYVFVNISNKKKELTNITSRQQYQLGSDINQIHFAKDVYIAPGQAKLAHNINTKLYDNSYIPYESSIPSIDVLRANNQNQISLPSYFKQYLQLNTTPFSNSLIKQNNKTKQ